LYKLFFNGMSHSKGGDGSVGILPKHLNILAMEKKINPGIIKGDVLTFSQQSVHATLDEVLAIFKRYQIPLIPLKDGFDTKNKIPQWVGTVHENRTNAQAVLTLLGADTVQVSDISPNEMPDFIIDLNNPVCPEFNQKFDVIFDIGTLEHIFDVPTALENIVRMLKPGGTVIIDVPASNSIDHGFYQFSPTLFFDFFSANGFEGFRCYLIETNPLNYLRKGRVWRYSGFGKECPIMSSKSVEVFFIATRHQETAFHKPMQQIYLAGSSMPPSLVKRLWDQYWRFCPEFIETLLLKMFRKHENLEYIGKF